MYKLIEKKTGFKTVGSRVELVMALQGLIFEKFGASANDLADGDAGVEGRGVRRRKVGDGSGVGKGKCNGKRKRAAGVVSLHGWEWDAKEKFIIERCVPTLLLITNVIVR